MSKLNIVSIVSVLSLLIIALPFAFAQVQYPNVWKTTHLDFGEESTYILADNVFETIGVNILNISQEDNISIYSATTAIKEAGAGDTRVEYRLLYDGVQVDQSEVKVRNGEKQNTMLFANITNTPVGLHNITLQHRKDKTTTVRTHENHLLVFTDHTTEQNEISKIEIQANISYIDQEHVWINTTSGTFTAKYDGDILAFLHHEYKTIKDSTDFSAVLQIDQQNSTKSTHEINKKEWNSSIAQHHVFYNMSAGVHNYTIWVKQTKGGGNIVDIVSVMELTELTLATTEINATHFFTPSSTVIGGAPLSRIVNASVEIPALSHVTIIGSGVFSNTGGAVTRIKVEFEGVENETLIDVTTENAADRKVGFFVHTQNFSSGGIKNVYINSEVNTGTSTITNLSFSLIPTVPTNIFNIEPDNPPASILLTPLNNSVVAQNTPFNCSALDDRGLSSIALYTNVTGSQTLAQTIAINGTSAQASFNYFIPANATIEWLCEVTDNATQKTNATSPFITTIQIIETFEAPVVSLIEPLQGAVEQAQTNLICSATDERNLVSLELYDNRTGAFSSKNTTAGSGLSLTSNISHTYDYGAVISWNCKATDNDSISSFAVVNRTFSITGLVNKNITLITPTNGSTVFNPVTFGFNTNATGTYELVINGAVARSIAGNVGDNYFSPYSILGGSQNISWYVQSGTDSSITFNNELIAASTILEISSCDNTIASNMLLYLGIMIGLILVLGGFALGSPFLTIFGGLSLMVSSWYVAACLPMLAFIIAAVGILTLIAGALGIKGASNLG